MIDRDSWGCCYSAARGEILRFPEEQLMRKHSPRMSSLIKNESWGIEDDQIPSDWWTLTFYPTSSAPCEKSKSLGSGGSMVARLKLKGIDGRTPPEVELAA
ncbi:hypothetical protein AAMO2058_001174600 [Amorphochlora amoebiformis]